MDRSLTHPKLRWPLDIRRETFQSKEILILSCPLGITKDPLILIAAVGPILASFEGSLSIDEIVERFKQYGVNHDLVTELVRLLDDSLFLQSHRFFEAERGVRESFNNASCREPYLAGLGYPVVPEALRAELEGYIGSRDLISKGKQELLCLISPHIDYRRGGKTYGASYRSLASENHDLYIVIGTSHQYSSGLFHLTKKDYLSPLGPARCDVAFVEELAKGYGITRSFDDEFLHKREHSLELQIPFLLHVKENAVIVPILVGSFHQMLRAGKLPNDYEEYDTFVSSLEEAVRRRTKTGSKICFIAGVDMAHIGTAFGDDTALTKEFLSDIESRDNRYLDAIGRRDKVGIFSHISEDLDSRRICGFPTMYTIVDLFERLDLNYEFSLFHYDQATDFESDRSVTFAGAGLYRKEALVLSVS